MQTSKFWIVKGNKNNPDRDGDIVKQMREYVDGIDRRENWWRQLGRPIHDSFNRKQGEQVVFAWRARRKIGIVGVGRLLKIKNFNLNDREHSFEWEPVDCWSLDQDSQKPDNQYITLDEIRSALSALPDKTEQNPSFTKASVIQTVYPVTIKQAEVLKSLIARKVKNLSKDARQLLGIVDAPS